MRRRATRSASGSVGELVAVGRMGDERMQRALQAEEHAGRPARHLRRDAQALARQRVDACQRVAPRRRLHRRLRQREGQHAAGATAELLHPGEIGLLALQVGDHLEDAVPRLRRGRCRSPSSSSGVECVPGTRPCRERCRMVREVEKPTAPARSASAVRRAISAISVAADLEVVGALAEDVGADRAVRHLRRDVEHARHARPARPGTRETTPSANSMPSCSAVPGMSSTPSISSMRKSSSPGPHRGEPDAAVAHHQRRHAVPARGRELRIPGDLAVVVRVHVDPAGRDEQSPRVDLAPCRGLRPRPTAVIVPASMATSPSKRSRPVPSTTVPLRITRSCMLPPIVRAGVTRCSYLGTALLSSNRRIAPVLRNANRRRKKRECRHRRIPRRTCSASAHGPAHELQLAQGGEDAMKFLVLRSLRLLGAALLTAASVAGPLAAGERSPDVRLPPDVTYSGAETSPGPVDLQPHDARGVRRQSVRRVSSRPLFDPAANPAYHPRRDERRQAVRRLPRRDEGQRGARRLRPLPPDREAAS